MLEDALGTEKILDLFTQETLLQGGRVLDSFHDGQRLFARSLLPNAEEVRPRDRFQGGLALRANDGELWLHPYLFRQVCSNGAIMAHALESVHLEQFEFETPEHAAESLRHAIVTCSAADVFKASLNKVRSATSAQADIMLNMLPFLSRLDQAGMGRILASILEHFSRESDRTRFGLMNAVTSVARDTENPDVRWRLEELGGDIGAGIRARQPANSPARSYADRDCVPAM